MAAIKLNVFFYSPLILYVGSKGIVNTVFPHLICLLIIPLQNARSQGIDVLRLLVFLNLVGLFYFLGALRSQILPPKEVVENFDLTRRKSVGFSAFRILKYLVNLFTSS